MSEERKIVTEIPENSETPLESVRSWVTPTPSACIAKSPRRTRPGARRALRSKAWPWRSTPRPTPAN